MLRMLPYLIVLGVVVASVLWLLLRLRPSQPALPKSAGSLPPRATAVLAYGPDQGPGELALSTSQLVFTAQTGRVLAIERLDIEGVTTTTDLPDRQAAAQVLAVATEREVFYFLVDEPARWVGLLT